MSKNKIHSQSAARFSKQSMRPGPRLQERVPVMCAFGQYLGSRQGYEDNPGSTATGCSWETTGLLTIHCHITVTLSLQLTEEKKVHPRTPQQLSCMWCINYVLIVDEETEVESSLAEWDHPHASAHFIRTAQAVSVNVLPVLLDNVTICGPC